jgi:hypothetical protein
VDLIIIFIISLKINLFSPWYSWKFAYSTWSFVQVWVSYECYCFSSSWNHRKLIIESLKSCNNEFFAETILKCQLEPSNYWEVEICFLRYTIMKLECGFEPWLGQTKDYEIGICCFSAKHAALRRKSKDWLARNQNNVSEWSDMSTRWQLFSLNFNYNWKDIIYLAEREIKESDYLYFIFPEKLMCEACLIWI